MHNTHAHAHVTSKADGAIFGGRVSSYTYFNVIKANSQGKVIDLNYIKYHISYVTYHIYYILNYTV